MHSLITHGCRLLYAESSMCLQYLLSIAWLKEVSCFRNDQLELYDLFCTFVQACACIFCVHMLLGKFLLKYISSTDNFVFVRCCQFDARAFQTRYLQFYVHHRCWCWVVAKSDQLMQAQKVVRKPVLIEIPHQIIMNYFSFRRVTNQN